MRTIFSFVVALMSCSLAAAAQTLPADAVPNAAPIGIHRVRQSAADINPELEAARTADQLTGQLGLSPGQAERVRAAAALWAQQRQTLLRKHDAQADHSTLHQESAAIKAQYESQLQAILTPAQAERCATIQARFRRIREQASLEDHSGTAPAPTTRP